MNFLPAFIVVTLVLFMANWVQSEKEECHETAERKTDAMNAMRICNSNIKYCYDEHDDDDSVELKDLYCYGMKTLLRCAFRKRKAFVTKHNCRSKLLDKWVFVSYQYALIGQKIGMCNYDVTFQTQLSKLKDIFDNASKEQPAFKNKNIYYTTIPGEQVRTCAYDIHENCAKELVAKTLEHDLCSSVFKFVYCYQNKVGVDPPVVPASCKGHVPDISTTFNYVIQFFSNYLVDLYKDDKAIMCKVHQGDLEGDCLAD